MSIFLRLFFSRCLNNIYKNGNSTTKSVIIVFDEVYSFLHPLCGEHSSSLKIQLKNLLCCEPEAALPALLQRETHRLQGFANHHYHGSLSPMSYQPHLAEQYRPKRYQQILASSVSQVVS
jgi:hypothetical protein